MTNLKPYLPVFVSIAVILLGEVAMTTFTAFGLIGDYGLGEEESAPERPEDRPSASGEPVVRNEESPEDPEEDPESPGTTKNRGEPDGNDMRPPTEDMVLIPEGTFTMGCAPKDRRCKRQEKPGHKVALGAFKIDRFEVTVSDYRACVNAGTCSPPQMIGRACEAEPAYFNWGRSDRGEHPVNCVTWEQSTQYCEWLDKRLPTEAEWEKAARGKDGRIHPWGNEDASCEVACMIGSAAVGCGRNSTCPVGAFETGVSPFGVHDMAGNVWEWTADFYDKGYYRKSPKRDPTGPPSGKIHTLRGGGFDFNKTHMRASNRLGFPLPRGASAGFRCARSEP